MDQVELIVALVAEVKGLSNYLTNPDDYENAISDACRETGWALPVTTNFKIYWLKDRAKRHLFFYLFSESTYKFKFENINLQQRFEHLKTAIEYMDKLFVDAQESNPTEFATVDSFQLFGSKIDAGFLYESQTGIDLTYDSSNIVQIKPDESD